MGQRTSERVSAGKRAAKYIACTVCEERVAALFPSDADADQIGRVVEAEIGDHLGDAKTLCAMKPLARLFRGRRLEVSPKPDGSAELRATKKHPLYEEINTSELAFHWKSLAVQHACMETFRKDGDAVAAAFGKAYAALAEAADEAGDAKQPGGALAPVWAAAQSACRKARMCRAAAKLNGEAAPRGAEL
ncbi:unnamed protein product [Prorocentrum cordatum]|uniref:Uncharacterized protein n=1 Tax=Prorocentrum cordatum TaxID=2364126 RepID=A0ABN9V7L7_9DINO|nr:unnamed protein product [Polarella glacialis]